MKWEMDDIVYHLSKEIGLHLPEVISRGNHRVVWSMSDPGLVLKLPRYNKRFDVYNGMRSNLQEWWIWHNTPELRPWLCRPVRLELDGLGLVMERGESITREQLPHKVPKIIAKNDNTYPNWVIVDGALKRCDYHALYKSIIKKRKL